MLLPKTNYAITEQILLICLVFANSLEGFIFILWIVQWVLISKIVR